jgi:hypothetical protein
MRGDFVGDFAERIDEIARDVVALADVGNALPADWTRRVRPVDE